MRAAFLAIAPLLASGLLLSGCGKSGGNSSPNSGAVSGPITDSGDTGLRAKPGAAVAMGDPKHGADIFSQNCASCHGAQGAGGGIGPRLRGEKKRKDYQQAIVWIKNPRAPMPKLYPAPLSESDVQDVAAYIETL